MDDSDLDGSDAHPNAIHLLRTMQQHHVMLSSMADQKANILIGVNSVILALVVRDAAVMTMPMLVLAATSAAAAVLCMLAVVPSFGRSRTAPGEPNMLFFGTFADLTEADYIARLNGIMQSDAEIRTAMARDIHQLGLVLKRKKYRYLGWGYRVFIIGIGATLLAFGVERFF